MGIFSRIRGFFSSCIRPSTSSSLNNEENDRFLGQNSEPVQNEWSRNVPSTSTADSNHHTIQNIANESTSKSAQKSVNKTSISRSNEENRNVLGQNGDTLQKDWSTDIPSTSTCDSTAIKHTVNDSTTKSNKATIFENTDITSRPPNTKRPYFLQAFISTLSSSQNGKRAVTPASDVIYLDEWTHCTAIIFDKSSHRLSPTHTVQLSSDSRVEFRDCKLQNGCLQFSMKALNVKTITIFFNIDKYPVSCTLSKKINVRYNPSSIVNAEMTIKSIKESCGFNECVFQVSIFDVWGALVSPCKLEVLSLGQDEVIQKKRLPPEAGHISFEITVRGNQPWSRDLVVMLNGQPVPNAEKIEVFDKLRELCCRAIQKGDLESIPDFIEFYGSRIFIPLSVGNDDGKFLPYNEDNCELLPGACQLVCKNTKRCEILGSGSAHINNIARILKLKQSLNVHENQRDNTVIIDLSNAHSNRFHICKKVVQHLLRGLYYRTKASQAASVRMEWKNRIAALGKHPWSSQSARVCKFLRDHFGYLMNCYNREASDELFQFFNFNRDVSEIDLHGLYVADEKKLEMLRFDLLRGLGNGERMSKTIEESKLRSFNGRSKQALINDLVRGKFPADEVEDLVKCCRDSGLSQKKLKVLEQDLANRSERCEEVNGIIKKFRAEGDEAIRKLKKTLETFNLNEAIKNNTPWLEIIVGAGHHSRIKNEQNIRPKVEKLLKERNLKFAAVNKGSLVVTFQFYSGPEPCFGEYYCEKCDRCWKSNNSYVGKYQNCTHCNDICWPVKQRKRAKVVNYHRGGARSATKRQTDPYRGNHEEECVII